MKLIWAFYDEVPQVGMELSEIYIKAGLVNSKSDFRRNVEGGAVRVMDKKVSDPRARLVLDSEASEYILLQKKGA